MRQLRALAAALLVLCAAGSGLAEVNLGGDSTAHLHVAPETLTNNWLVELNREGGEQLGRDVAARNGFLFVRKVYLALPLITLTAYEELQLLFAFLLHCGAR